MNCLLYGKAGLLRKLAGLRDKRRLFLSRTGPSDERLFQDIRYWLPLLRTTQCGLAAIENVCMVLMSVFEEGIGGIRGVYCTIVLLY